MAQIDSIPLPQQVPIERAGWNTDFSGNVQLPNNERTPVNPIDIANQQAVMQSQNALRGAQTADATQDFMQKQRNFQNSILNGYLALPPDQRDAIKPNIIKMFNQAGPTQLNPDNVTDAQLQLINMQNVPTAEVPTYAMNQQIPNVMQGIRDKLSGNTQNSQPAGATPMSQNGIINPPPQGTQMLPNGVIGGGQSPIPPGGGLPIDTATLTSMATIPALAGTAKDISSIQNASPQGAAAIEAAKTEGKNTGENVNLSAKAEQLTQRLQQNLEAMLKLNPDVPSTGIFKADDKVRVDQAINANKNAWWMPKSLSSEGAGNAVDAATQWDQINNQQVISEIQQFINTAGAGTRTNQTLEKIVNAASSIPKDAPPETRAALIKNALAEIKNKNVSAQNLTGANQPYSPIPVNTEQQPQQVQGNQPQKTQNNAQPPAGAPPEAKQAPNGNWYSPDPSRPGKYIRW